MRSLVGQFRSFSAVLVTTILFISSDTQDWIKKRPGNINQGVFHLKDNTYGNCQPGVVFSQSPASNAVFNLLVNRKYDVKINIVK